jgi:23S rRNA (uracil1939-C5)-methyltransferase
VPETVRIDALGHAGDGIAETSTGRVFVPFTLPGETVEIEIAGARPRPLRIVEASPDRVDPICRHFGACGGCALQHMATDAYLAWKRDIVRTSFALHGIDAPVGQIMPAAKPGSRRRAVFSVARTANGVVLGYHRRHANEIIAVTECPVLAPSIVAKLPLIREIATIALKPRRQARVTVLAADNGLDIAVDGGGALADRAAATLGRFGVDAAIARLTVNGVEVFRNRLPEIAAGPGRLFPPPAGFVQAVRAAEEALAETVAAFVGDAAPVADLFAGIGTFTLRLAASAPVTAVEGDAALIAALEAAVRHATGIKRVTARRRDLFANPMSPVELNEFGAVVFDPPAAGAKAQSEMLARSKVKMIAAVSCNPATLARDARILIDGGYRLVRVVPVDQFLFSAEIEAVALLER